MANFYVYIIFRPNGIPCYVGKGSGGRWRRQCRYPRKGSHLRHIVDQAGGELPIVLIGKDSELDAYETETALIAVLGLKRDGGLLVNHGYGGEGGPHGIRQSERQKAKRALDATAMWANEAMRSRIIAKQQGNQNSKKHHVLTDEWLNKLRTKMMGNTFTLGLRHTDEARAQMTAAGKGKPKPPRTAEHRANLSRAQRGRSRQRWLDV